jgi:hypothetical protein
MAAVSFSSVGVVQKVDEATVTDDYLMEGLSPSGTKGKQWANHIFFVSVVIEDFSLADDGVERTATGVKQHKTFQVGLPFEDSVQDDNHESLLSLNHSHCSSPKESPKHVDVCFIEKWISFFGRYGILKWAAMGSQESLQRREETRGLVLLPEP